MSTCKASGCPSLKMAKSGTWHALQAHEFCVCPKAPDVREVFCCSYGAPAQASSGQLRELRAESDASWGRSSQLAGLGISQGWPLRSRWVHRKSGQQAGGPSDSAVRRKRAALPAAPAAVLTFAARAPAAWLWNAATHLGKSL